MKNFLKWFGLLLLLVTGASVIWGWTYPTRGRVLAEPVNVEIARGMTLPAISELLSKKGVIGSPVTFRVYAKARKLSGKVRSGTYRFAGETTPEMVLNMLVAGAKELEIAVTIPEGRHLLEVIGVIDSHGIAPADMLEKIARDPAFLKEMNIPGPTIDGYLFPDTYRFRPNTKPRVVLTRMVARHREVWADISSRHAKRLSKLKEDMGWSDHDILTMASIVEKEAVVDRERSTIAQVFINRLRSPKFQPKRLETDPTIRYGCSVPLKKSAGCKKWDPSQRLRRAQLDDSDNLYNTYQHEGLPPGPICNPGAKAIEATVTPDGSGFFFFVARNDGTHVFSKTLRQHQRGVDKYQK